MVPKNVLSAETKDKMTLYSTGNVIICCPLNHCCLTAYLCDCSVLKLSVVGMHRSLAKQDKFPCNPVPPLAFNIWLFKKFPPQNVKAPLLPPDPATATHPSDIVTLDKFLYERCHLYSAGDFLALHLHSGFLPGIYCTLLKQILGGNTELG
jgi:hypothetical protein